MRVDTAKKWTSTLMAVLREEDEGGVGKKGKGESNTAGETRT